MEENPANGRAASDWRGQAEAASSSADQTQPTTNNGHISVITESIVMNVNLNLVRKMIAQNLIEILIVCVIITYLIYYFNQISRKPKLIGNDRSKFFKFIKQTLGNETLGRRFQPLIYFWGTNPQTALFGYLQGQSSLDEMPRNHFKRQYLYVSDVQYLTSNVDLSQHYCAKNNTTSANADQQQQQKQRPQQVRPFELRCDLLANLDSGQHQSSQLDQNIRLALDELASSGKQSKDKVLLQDTQVASQGDPVDELKEHDVSSGASDSGVSTGHSPWSASSSASSLSDVVIGSSTASVTSSSGSKPSKGGHCSCKSRYHHQVVSFTAKKTPKSQDEELTQPAELAREREEFGQCALDWHKASHRHYHRNRLVALISAGMTTGSDKKYVTDTVQTLDKLGYEAVVFIRRGVGGLKLSSSKFFSPAKWRDFEAAVLSVREQRPHAHLVAIGFSFGSIELCRYLSMSGRQSRVDAALLISCPFDPEAGGRNMRRQALNRRIDAYLARNLGKQLHQAMFESNLPNDEPDKQRQPQHQANKQQVLQNYNGSQVNLAKLPKIKSLVDFEDNYNRVLQNYPNSEAYAADSRLQGRLKNIATPTLCLSSEDDFMAPARLLPLEEIKANEKLCMLLTKRGGHMAFIDGLLWPKRPYFAQRIIERYMGALRASLREPDGLSFERFADAQHLVQFV